VLARIDGVELALVVSAVGARQCCSDVLMGRLAFPLMITIVILSLITMLVSGRETPTVNKKPTPKPSKTTKAPFWLPSPSPWQRVTEQITSTLPSSPPIDNDNNNGAWYEYLHRSPDVILVHHFLSSLQCASLRRLHDEHVYYRDPYPDWCFGDSLNNGTAWNDMLIRHGLSDDDIHPRPHTDGHHDGDEKCVRSRNAHPPLHQHYRVSTSVMVPRNSGHTIIDNIDQQLEGMLSLNRSNLFTTQIVGYHGQGSDYLPHIDCEPSSINRDEAMLRNDRDSTILVYLNTLPLSNGGATKFIHLNISVQPEEGAAIIWSNLDNKGRCSPQMVHAGWFVHHSYSHPFIDSLVVLCVDVGTAEPLLNSDGVEVHKYIYQRWIYEWPILPVLLHDEVALHLPTKSGVLRSRLMPR
jgi:hypothetical protein